MSSRSGEHDLLKFKVSVRTKGNEGIEATLTPVNIAAGARWLKGQSCCFFVFFSKCLWKRAKKKTESKVVNAKLQLCETQQLSGVFRGRWSQRDRKSIEFYAIKQLTFTDIYFKNNGISQLG